MSTLISSRTNALIALMAIVIAVGAAAPSAVATPTGEFAQFADCPLKVSAVQECLFAQTTGGEFKIKTTTVPIRHTIILQGGLPETEGNETLVSAADGNTLSKTPQPVPGGLLALVNCPEIKNVLARVACELVFENGTTGVNTTAELVGAVTINQFNLLLEEGIAVTLPVRVHLENPFLGGACYVGSASSPVTLALTTGFTKPPPPNKPIRGKGGDVEGREEGNILVVNNNSLVNNSYSVPEATGCGGLFSLAVNPLVNAKLGLPSTAGNNTAILNGTLKIATREGVEKSEK